MAKSKQLKRLTLKHHQIIDWMIANPGASGVACAGHFSLNPCWISIVINSPVFEGEMKRRRRAIEEELDVKMAALADVSVDALTVRVEEEGDTMPINDLVRITKMLLTQLDFSR